MLLGKLATNRLYLDVVSGGSYEWKSYYWVPKSTRMQNNPKI